jgi:hypothetical protein
MNRRSFFARVAGVAAVTTVSGPALPAAAAPPLRDMAWIACSHCGDQLYLVRREPQAYAEIWSCGRCRRSYRVPYQWMHGVERVDYEEPR